MPIYESTRSRLYRDPRNGKIKGVCAGIADYTGTSIAAVRILTVLALFFTGGTFVFIAYFVLAFTLDRKPSELYEAPPEEQEFWKDVRTAPKATVRAIRLRFKETERRLNGIERYVTSNRYKLDREFENLR
ncbi:MAG: envelope stress response membrane protein PspC [Pseudomonadota bacterium]